VLSDKAENPVPGVGLPETGLPRLVLSRGPNV
jgi:hypothetical protein